MQATRLSCFASITALSCAAAMAQPGSDFTASTGAVEDARLDQMRGGFDTGNLHIGFGLDRITSVNGSVVYATQVQVSDLSQLRGDQARSLLQALDGMLVVQDGAAGRVPGGGAAVATWIQNRLDNQVIRQSTTLTAVTNSLGVLKSLNAMGSLDDALRQLPHRP
jgi:hypothetical protein